MRYRIVVSLAPCLMFGLITPTLILSQAPPTTKQALDHMGIPDDPASLRRALHDKRAAARSAAASELAQQKDLSAVRELENVMQTETDPYVAYTMASSLHQLGSEQGTQHLLTYCKGNDAPIVLQMEAADALATTGNYECASSVGKNLSSQDDGVRESALLYLSKVPSSQRRALESLGPALIAASRDPNKFFRQLAGKAIAQIGDKRTREMYQHQ